MYSHFKASQAAGLIGKNSFEPKEAELLKAALSYKNPRLKSLCYSLRDKYPEVKKALLMLSQEKNMMRDMQEVRNAVEEAVQKRKEVEEMEIIRLAEEAKQQAEKKKREAEAAYARSREAEKKARLIEERAVEEARLAKKVKTEQLLVEALEKKISSEEQQLRKSVLTGKATKEEQAQNNVLITKRLEYAQTITKAVELEAEGRATIAEQSLAKSGLFLDSFLTVKAKEAEDQSMVKSAQEVREAVKEANFFDSESAKAKSISQSLSLIAEPVSMQQAIAKAVCMKRGREEEEEILDEKESTLGSITERNKTLGSIQGETYYLVGLIDGISSSGIVELKTHRHMPYRPREKDIIQLRIYLRMFKQKSGILIEKSYRGECRETIVEDKDEEWNWIDSELNSAGKELQDATEIDILNWCKKVIALNIKG